MQYVLKNRQRGHKSSLAIVVIICTLFLVFGALEFSGVTHVFHKETKPVASGGDSSAKGEPTNAVKDATATQKNTHNNLSQSTGNSSSASIFSGILLAPSGDFVSAHHVSSNTLISSVCNTSSGATCAISFTKGNVTKSLSTEMTDVNGSVYWNAWTPQSLDLSAGTWQVKAVAAGGGQTKTSNDALPLEISP